MIMRVMMTRLLGNWMMKQILKCHLPLLIHHLPRLSRFGSFLFPRFIPPIASCWWPLATFESVRFSPFPQIYSTNCIMLVAISNDLTYHLLTCPLIAGSDTLVTAKNTEHFKRTINYYLTLAFD